MFLLLMKHFVLRTSHVSTAKQTYYVVYFACLCGQTNMICCVLHMSLILNKFFVLRAALVYTAKQTYYVACFISHYG